MDEIPFPTGPSNPPIYITTTPVWSQNGPSQPSFSLNNGLFSYPVQSGDTLESVARHFGVSAVQITASQSINPTGVLIPGQILFIPNNLEGNFTSANLFPDSEVVFAPTAADFDIDQYINSQGGYLSTYHETIDDEDLSGSEIIERIAVSNSVNPRLLLALVEFRTGLVRSTPAYVNPDYPLGLSVTGYRGFYLETALITRWLNAGYYGWRQGLFTDLTFLDGASQRVEPQLNAGSVALEYLFSQMYYSSTWHDVLYGDNSFLALYTDMFGDPWQHAASVEPLITPVVAQPVLELPFSPGEEWALTGGIHYDWNSGTPLGALDFAPVTGEPACSVSRAWVLAPASGRISYSDNSIVILDVFDDQARVTGWQVFFMHIAASERVPQGSIVARDDRIGHPSCEGGKATGTHFHIARRYNGEWLATGDPFPFILGGWTALPASTQFQSSLVSGDQVVTSSINGNRTSRIVR
jgi:LysM repeat protein